MTDIAHSDTSPHRRDVKVISLNKSDSEVNAAAQQQQQQKLLIQSVTPAYQAAPAMIIHSRGDGAEERMGRETEYHASVSHATVVDEVSRRRRATYRRRFTTMFGGASAADGAAGSAAGEVTTWEDDELDDDEHFFRERARCRLERLQMQQKKTRKKTPRR